MAQLHYRDLLVQDPTLVTGDTITTVSETTSTTAKQIGVKSISPHTSVGKYYGFRSGATIAQSIPNATWTTVDMGNASYDIQGTEFNEVTSAYTPVQSGYYLFTCGVYYVTPNEAAQYETRIRLWNGTGEVASNNSRSVPAIINANSLGIAIPLYLIAPISISVQIYTDFPTGVEVGKALFNTNTYFSCIRVG